MSKKFLVILLCFFSINVLADNLNPQITCPLEGTSVSDAEKQGWNQLYGPGTVTDPLAYYSNIPVGPRISGGYAYCTYQGTVPPGVGQLIHSANGNTK